ncbi:MAG: helicase C-terminal domain-containing protein [Parachlamydiaceae bacterium]
MNCNPPTLNRIDVEAALSILSSTGPIASILKGFESRSEQQAMMRNIFDAYHHNNIALIEAGTGTGKSLAYLIPAMLWAAETKERTVISTNTIPLQEQLISKDIPLINKALNLNIKAVLVKGMHNYHCFKKSEDLQQELLLLTPQEVDEIQKIDAWKHTTQDGSRSSLPFSPSPSTWEKVAAESDSCTRNKCPYFQQCHFFKARRQAQEAQILVVNHHLLFADLVCRMETDNFQDPAILPPYQRIVLDEAHNIEDIATDYFASRISHIGLMRVMARLTAEKTGKAYGKLPILKDKLMQHYRKESPSTITSLLNRLSLDLPGLRRDLLQHASETFTAFFDFSNLLQDQNSASSKDSSHGESKLRILPYHYTHPFWKERLSALAKRLSDSIMRYAAALNALTTDLKQLKNTQLEEQIRGIVFEINALSTRLSEMGTTIDQFVGSVIPKTKVRWMELSHMKTMINTTLVDADLDVSKNLVDYLFSKFSTIILCSATMTTGNNFDFIRNRLGLTPEKLKQRHIKEHVYNSPFDFQKQALLAVPTDMPNPNEAAFIPSLIENIWNTLESSQGNAFVLFTSYSMLTECFKRLEPKMREHRFNPLKQGDDDRHTLLNKFKTINHSVLFGTDSFWEGIDVAGDALRCVIIAKLPFKVPTDPLIQGRSEAISARGGDPFTEYSLPQAIVKFKQGFGRLIRNKTDRGCVVCLDNRIIKKQYGKLFLESLPACQHLFLPGKDLPQQLKDFYRRTYFMTKK